MTKFENARPFDTSKSPSDLVREFHTAFGLTNSDPALWRKLIREELDEWKEALDLLCDDETVYDDPKRHKEAITNFLKEIADVMYVISGLRLVLGEKLTADDLSPEDLTLFEEVYHALSATLEVFPSDAVHWSIALVHESNMTKLGDDGKPVYREDGKVMKGPNYKAPDLGPIYDFYNSNLSTTALN